MFVECFSRCKIAAVVLARGRLFYREFVGVSVKLFTRVQVFAEYAVSSHFTTNGGRAVSKCCRGVLSL